MVLHLCRNGVFFSDCCRSLDLSLFFFSSVPSLPLLRFFFIFFSVFSLHLQHSEHRRNPISNIHQVRHPKHRIKSSGDKIQNCGLVEQIDAFLIFLRLLCYLHPSSSLSFPSSVLPRIYTTVPRNYRPIIIGPTHVCGRREPYQIRRWR